MARRSTCTACRLQSANVWMMRTVAEIRGETRQWQLERRASTDGRIKWQGVLDLYKAGYGVLYARGGNLTFFGAAMPRAGRGRSATFVRFSHPRQEACRRSDVRQKARKWSNRGARVAADPWMRAMSPTRSTRQGTSDRPVTAQWAPRLRPSANGGSHVPDRAMGRAIEL